jgi:hypothetical protein
VLDQDRRVQQYAVGGVDGVDDGLSRGLGADVDERRRLDLDIGNVRIGDEDGSGGSTQADERALVDLEHDPPALRRYLRGAGAVWRRRLGQGRIISRRRGDDGAARRDRRCLRPGCA